MTKLRFLVSLITKDNDYQMEQAASARSAAAEYGVDVDIVYAENDATTQGTQLFRVIQADPPLRPNGIIVEPLGATSFPKVASVAAKKCLPRSFAATSVEPEPVKGSRTASPGLGADVDSEHVLRQWIHTISGPLSRYGLLLGIPLIAKESRAVRMGTILWRVR